MVLTFSAVLGLSLSVFAQENSIPSWIKNTAGFWVDNQIGDEEFIQALQWLIDNDVLQVTQKDPEFDEMTQETNLPSVEIGYDCFNHIGETWKNPDDHGYMEYSVTVQNFDENSHSAVIEVVDKTDNGNILNSKTIEVTLKPNEIKKVTENLERSALSSPICVVNLVSIK